MHEYNFYIEIETNKVQIAEPWEFSDTPFSVRQNKEYFYRKLAFAGAEEKTELKFKSDIHDNIFDELINQSVTKGTNAEVYFYFDDIKMRLDYATIDTDYYSYFNCQAINSDALSILDDNKDVKVDLLSNLDIYNNGSTSISLKRAYATAMGINRESNWKNDKEVTVGTNTSRSGLFINTISKINRSDIKNTYVPPQDFFRRDWNSWWARKMYQFISFRDNYKNVIIDLKINQEFYTYRDMQDTAKLTLFIGREDLEDWEWYDSCSKYTIAEVSKSAGTYRVIENKTVNLYNIPRGYGMWMCWECRTVSVTTAERVSVTDYGSEVNVRGVSYSFGSIIYSDTYVNCINNLVKKIVPNTNVIFNVGEYLQGNNLLFSGNQIRFDENKPFLLTWKDIKEQFKEFGLGYRLEGNAIVVDNIESFYKDSFIHHFDTIDTPSFKIAEDTEYHVNLFEYKYKKYQALKENSIEGNAGTTNGESQWYIQNRFTEGKLTIDLPISRDKFLLEDTRIQSLAYNENTSTNEDSTLYLFDANQGTVTVNETAFLRATFNEDSGYQSFSVRDNEFSWLKIGLEYSSLINFVINGVDREYLVLEISSNTIVCARINHTEILNTDSNFNFWFNANVYYNINVGNSNDKFSIRQNIQEMRAFLTTYNYYNTTSITNTEYKENADFVYNDIKETDPIQNVNSFNLTPKTVSFNALDDYELLSELQNNINGYCTVKSPLGNIIKFYIKELNLLMKDKECGQARFEVKGQIYE